MKKTFLALIVLISFNAHAQTVPKYSCREILPYHFNVKPTITVSPRADQTLLIESLETKHQSTSLPKRNIDSYYTGADCGVISSFIASSGDGTCEINIPSEFTAGAENGVMSVRWSWATHWLYFCELAK